MSIIPSIYLWGIGSAVFAMSGMVIAHRLVKPIDLAQHQASLDATLNIVGTLVSILLGLLVAASLNSYQTLQSTIDAEATSVADICRLSFGLPITEQKQILQTSLDYCDYVIADEWPHMASGIYNEKGFLLYTKILRVVVTFNPKTNGQTNIQSALISSTQALGDYRRVRVLWLHNNWIKNLMPVLIMCSLIVLLFAYLYVKRGAGILHGFLICFVATALGANLGLIYVLNHPFDGDWKIQPKGFEYNAQLIRHYTDVR